MLIEIERHRIHFDLVGPSHARTVCMVHGLTLDGGLWFQQVPALLERGYRVLRLDLYGHGGTPPVAGDYTLSQLAAMVASLIRGVVGGPVDYVGLSIGGMIGQTLALEHPDVMRSALWSDTRAGYDLGEGGDWEHDLRTVIEAGSLEPMADSYMLYSLSPRFIERHPQVSSLLRGMMVNTTVGGFVGCSAAIKDFDNRPLLEQVKVPVLVVCGSEDKGTPLEANRLIAHLVPDARLEIIAGGRHTPNVEFPVDFNRLMVGWLDGRAQPRV